MTHSPTPWLVDTLGGESMSFIMSADEHMVCGVACDGGPSVADQNHIVQAVNSHAELIDLLRTCRDRLECHSPHVAEKIDRVLERENAQS